MHCYTDSQTSHHKQFLKYTKHNRLACGMQTYPCTDTGNVMQTCTHKHSKPEQALHNIGGVCMHLL